MVGNYSPQWWFVLSIIEIMAFGWSHVMESRAGRVGPTAASMCQKLHSEFQHTMLRVKDPKVTIDFYTKHFGMKLIHK